MNSMQYSDNICEAIDIIAKNVVKGLNFDQTILCTITDDSQAKKGEYLVTDDSSIYNVISNNHTYKTGTQVYVLIPKGDYSQQKIIISEYSIEKEQDEDNKGYIKPIDTIIPVEEIYNNPEEQWGLTANYNQVLSQGSATTEKFLDINKDLTKGPQYTRLSVEASFRTQFDQDIISGDYSLVFFLSGDLVNGEAVEKKPYLFNCDRFFGNPYHFDTEVSQSIVFDISDFKILDKIEIQFQESGNFYIEGNQFLQYGDVKKPENLFVKNIKLILGFGIEEYQNNDLILTSKDPLEYSSAIERNLQLNWIRKRNNNTMFSINSLDDINEDNYKYLTKLKDKKYLSIYWYKYLLTSTGTQDLYTKDYFYSIDKYYNNSDIYSDLDPTTEIKGSNPFEFTFTTDINNKSFERIKSAIAITGCLRKKILKTQFITVDDGTTKEVAILKKKERPFYILEDDWTETYELDYDCIYYDPLNESDIEEFISEEKIDWYYWDKGTYVLYKENENTQKEIVEWVRQYEQRELSRRARPLGTEIEINRDSEKNVIYNETFSFIYLSDSERDDRLEEKAYYITNLKSTDKYYQLVGQDYDDGVQKPKSANAYRLELVPITFLISNPVTFENNFTDAIDPGNINLIDKLELDCLDELKGKYFIYGEDNTIPASVANNTQRYIQATFNFINSKDVISGPVEIQWKIPANRTMIADPLPDTPYSGLMTGPAEKKEEITGTIKWDDINTTKDFWIGKITLDKRTESDKLEDEGVYSISIKIPYQIKSYYSPSLVNNTIQCIVSKLLTGKTPIENKSNYEFRFGPAGMNGTNYVFTLSLGPAYERIGDEDAESTCLLGEGTVGDSVLNINGYSYKIKDPQRRSFIKKTDTDTYIFVEPSLYNGKNLLLDLNSEEISWSWYNSSNKYTSSQSTIDFISIDDKCYLKSTYDETNNKYQAEKHCAILQAEIVYNNIKLTAYLPIPMAFNDNISGVELADKIIYNSDGVNPTYYKNPSKLFMANSENTNISNVIYVNRKKMENKNNNGQYPLFKFNSPCAITVPPIYYKNQEKDLISISLIDNNTNKTLFIQPILIIQNRFGNAMLNEWDGSLIIDEDNNRILSAQIAAGEKNSDNSFSGVLMGAVGKNSLDSSTTKYGLYGYAKGALSFGFKEDGTAFIGNSGSGRIEFDGNKGLIQSSNYITNGTGMSINLQTGKLISKNSGGQILIDSNNSKQLFQVQNSQNNVLINVGEDNYFFQSSGYNNETKKGFKLNLNSNGFDLTNSFETIFDINNTGILLSNENNVYFRIQKKRQQKAVKKSFKWADNITYTYDFYIRQDGTSLIMRNTSSNNFYKAALVLNGKDVDLQSIKPFATKSEEIETSKYRYKILGEIALKQLEKVLNRDRTQKAPIVFRSDGWILSNDEDKIINANLDTDTYYLADWCEVIYDDSQLYFNARKSGKMNCLAHHKSSDTIFAAVATDEEINKSKLGAYKYDPTTGTYSAKTCMLKQSSTEGEKEAYPSNEIYDIAIDSNGILYVQVGHSISLFTIPEDFTVGDRLLYDKKSLDINKFFNEQDLYGDKKTSPSGREYFTYQGMAVDDKYFYFPVMKTKEDSSGKKTTDYTCQCLDVRLKKNPSSQASFENGYSFDTGKFIQILNIPFSYEIEDIEIVTSEAKNTFMFLSFTNIEDDGYITKIYRIPFDNTKLTGVIDLHKDATGMWIKPIIAPANLIKEGTNVTGESKDLSAYKFSQGFTIGQDKNKNYYFVNGYPDPTPTKNEKTSWSLMTFSYYSGDKIAKNFENINLINIEKETFYLQSYDYRNNRSGAAFNLKTGYLYATNAKIKGTITGSTITGSTITGGIITGGIITGSTIQTGTSGSNIQITTGGVIQFYYNNNLYGVMTTTGSNTEKYWTLLGNYNASNCVGITFGWSQSGTAGIFLKQTGMDFKGSIGLQDLNGAQSGTVLTYEDEIVKFGANQKILSFYGSKIKLPISPIQYGTDIIFQYDSTYKLLKFGAEDYPLQLHGTYINLLQNVTYNSNTVLDCTSGLVKFGIDSQPLQLHGMYINLLQNVAYNGKTVLDCKSGPVKFGIDSQELEFHFKNKATFSGTGKTVYIGNLKVSTESTTGSDRNLKHSITALTNNQEQFFLSLKPVNYKYTYGTSDRYHCGFIAQDVLKAIEDNNLTTQDIAAYVEEKSDETPDGLSRGLRYGEFVALNTHMIQKCLKRIDELEIEVSHLKAQLN